MEETVISKKDILTLQQSANKDKNNNAAENEVEEDVEVENIERPVDLYKVATILLMINTFI